MTIAWQGSVSAITVSGRGKHIAPLRTAFSLQSAVRQWGQGRAAKAATGSVGRGFSPRRLMRNLPQSYSLAVLCLSRARRTAR